MYIEFNIKNNISPSNKSAIGSMVVKMRKKTFPLTLKVIVKSHNRSFIQHNTEWNIKHHVRDNTKRFKKDVITHLNIYLPKTDNPMLTVPRLGIEKSKLLVTTIKVTKKRYTQGL